MPGKPGNVSGLNKSQGNVSKKYCRGKLEIVNFMFAATAVFRSIAAALAYFLWYTFVAHCTIILLFRAVERLIFLIARLIILITR